VGFQSEQYILADCHFFPHTPLTALLPKQKHLCMKSHQLWGSQAIRNTNNTLYYTSTPEICTMQTITYVITKSSEFKI